VASWTGSTFFFVFLQLQSPTKVHSLHLWMDLGTSVCCPAVAKPSISFSQQPRKPGMDIDTKAHRAHPQTTKACVLSSSPCYLLKSTEGSVLNISSFFFPEQVWHWLQCMISLWSPRDNVSTFAVLGETREHGVYNRGSGENNIWILSHLPVSCKNLYFNSLYLLPHLENWQSNFLFHEDYTQEHI
jgi:hypothetical protein